MSRMKNKALALMFMTALLIGGCGYGHAESPATYPGSAEISDPIEPVNRAIFGFNQVVDRALLEPTAKVYRTLLPKFVRTAVHNFLRNLKSPILAANQLLQGDMSGTGEAVGRFAINTTLGLAGIFDVAKRWGMEYEDEDFGQTLGVWGMGHGFYLVLPVIGPSSLRDGVGLAVDAYADPIYHWTDNTDREWIYYTRLGVYAIDTRSRLLETVEDLRRNSLDYYAAVRSIYAQQRHAAVHDRGEDASVMVAIPDYDEEEDW